MFALFISLKPDVLKLGSAHFCSVSMPWAVGCHAIKARHTCQVEKNGMINEGRQQHFAQVLRCGGGKRRDQVICVWVCTHTYT